jgi:hypothetical protein
MNTTFSRISFLACAFFAAAACCDAANLVPGGDFTDAKPGKVDWCRAEEGRFSLFNEDYTWNNCGKVEAAAARTNGNAVTRSAIVSIGRDGKFYGFAVKPDTNYDFSLDLKGVGEVKSANVRVMGWHGDDYWRNRSVIKINPVMHLSLEPSWKTFKGTFRTPSNIKRAAIQISIWSGGKKLYAPGEFILFDNVKVEESKNNLISAPAAAKVERRKAVASGDAAFDDFVDLRTGEVSDVKTTVRAAAENGAFLFDILCDEPEGLSVNAEGGVWSGDSLEIWFGGVGEERVSTQLAIGANGRKYAAIDGEKASADIFDVKVERKDKAWSAKVRVPFASIGWSADAKKGDSIAFNVGRFRRNARKYNTWSPVENGFNDVAKFGELVYEDYSSALKARFGIEAACSTRAEYERMVVEAENAEQEAKFARFKGSRFLAAPVPVTSDFSVPFMPQEIFDPPKEIKLTAAINEWKALPLAIVNLAERAEDYAVLIEDGSQSNTGAFGLKGFPAENLTVRKALRMKDSGAKNPTMRFDPLPAMDKAHSITVPSMESGVVWFDFNTAGVAAGTYTGVLRIIPLGGYGTFLTGKGFNDLTYAGQMQVIPVTLEVRPIELPKRPASPTGLFMGGLTEEAFDYQVQIGTEYFNLSPWSFRFNLDKDGNIDFDSPLEPALKLRDTICTHVKWGAKHGFKPTFLICYSTVDIFRKLYNSKKDPEKDARLWPQYVLCVKRLMNECGISDEEYAIETYDEPPSDSFAEILSFHNAAKKAAPSVRLEITLGHRKLKVEEYRKLGEVTDEWIVWDNYFMEACYREFFAEQQRLGKSVRHYTCDTSPRVALDSYYRKKAWFGERYRLDGNSMYQLYDIRGGIGVRDFKVPTFGGIIHFIYGNVIPTIRFMAFREGVTDLRYFAKLREIAPGDPEVEKFIADAANRVLGSRKHDPKEPDRLREKAAKMIFERIKNK